MKKFYAGPWAGEFGWELCSWNPTIRYIAQNYDYTIVETQPGMETFYEFADEVIVNPRRGDYDMYAGSVTNPSFKVDAGTHVVKPNDFWRKYARGEFRAIKTDNKLAKLHPKVWRKYGDDPVETSRSPVDVMCAWRGPKVFKGRLLPEKQYPEDKCTKVVKLLLHEGVSVGCYGNMDNLYVDGTVDFRGIPDKELCFLLANTKVAVGPSSGTIHLASLCGTPHVTWYGRSAVSMARYLTYWNPFTTPVTFITGNCPAEEQVTKHVLDRLSGKPINTLLRV